MAKRAAKLSPFWAERLYPSALVQASPFRNHTDLPTELRPAGHSPEAIRRWIAAICRRLSTTPTELARRAKLAPSTVNRFLSGRGNNENVSASTIAKLTDAANSLFDEFMEKNSTLEEFSKNIEVESNWAGAIESSFDKTIIKVPIVGFISSEFWNVQTELKKEDRYEISVPIQNYYRNLPIIGLEMRGGTSNKKYTNTAILICVPYYALDREPVDGEFVVVNRKGAGEQVEVTVRQYIEEKFPETGEDGFGKNRVLGKWLVPLEGENRFHPPIDVSYSDDSSLLVSFLIIASFQTEHRLFRRPEKFDPKER